MHFLIVGAAVQAHYINNRSMEVFRGMAAPGQASIAKQIVQKAPPLHLWRKFLYCESMTGSLYGEVDHFKVPLCDALHPVAVAAKGQACLLQHVRRAKRWQATLMSAQSVWLTCRRIAWCPCCSSVHAHRAAARTLDTLWRL